MKGVTAVSAKTQNVVTTQPAIRGELWAAGAALGFTLSNMFDKLGLAQGNPYVGLIAKDMPLWIIAIVTCLSQGLFRQQLSADSPEYVGKQGWLPFVWSGPIMDAFGTVMFYVAMSLGGVVIAVPVVQSQVLWAAIIAHFMLGERFDRRTAIGSLVFVAGLVLLSLGQMQGAPVSSQWAMAIPLALIAGLGWSLGTVLWRKGLVNGTNKWVGMSIHYPMAWLAVIVYLMITGQMSAFNMPMKSAAAFAGSGVFSGVIAVTMFMNALNVIPVAKANIIKSSYPVLAAVFAWILFKEYLNVVMIVGIIITIVGLGIITRKSE